MKPVSTLGELQKLLDSTEQRLARVLIARERAAKDADYYRATAEQLITQAARWRLPEMRERLLQIASTYERLASFAEGTERFGEASFDATRHRKPPADDTQPSIIVAERGEEAVRHRPAEDAVAQARRHVAQAEGHIARQEALVARLSDDDRHLALAAEAREILDTLKHTLRLARDHLAIELKK